MRQVIRRSAPITILWFVCSIAYAQQIAVGQKVNIRPGMDQAELKEGIRVICRAYQLDYPVTVERVQGDWLWLGDTKYHGWIKSSAVWTTGQDIQYWTDEIRKNPIAANYLERGDAYACNGDHDLAIKDFTEVIRLAGAEPDSGVAYGNRGEIYLAKGDNQNAVKDLTEGIRRLANRPDRLYEAYRLRAIAHDKLGEKDAADKDRQEVERIKTTLASLK